MSGGSTQAVLDTSYVVRYLVKDPPDMSQKAADVIDGEESLWLSEMRAKWFSWRPPLTC